MNNLNHLYIKLRAYLLFVAIGALITCVTILASPSDPKNAIAFGYSLERIALATGLILFALPPLFLTWKLLKNPQHSQRLWQTLFKNNAFYLITAIAFFFFFILLLLPSYRLGSIAPYVLRLYPILVWLAVITVVTMLLFIFERKEESLWSIITENKIALQAGIIALVILAFITLLVIFTGVGIRRPEDYWYGAGVPVLGLQVLLCLIIGAVFALIELVRGIKNTFQFDLIFCLILFILTAYLWAREPLLPNYFMPDTAKNTMYPYSDSSTFDVGSQFALIGQGLFNGQFFDRALYSSFLTYLHFAFGQNVERVLTAQAIFFSIFPVTIYLIGKELHSRALGISLGVLISLRGINAILAATWIDLAGPKMMTTDFPTAIGIALFLLFAIKWIKDSSKIYFAVLAGGMLGMTLMLRTHILLLMPAIILFIFLLASHIRWNYRIIGSLVLILGMVTATMPWDLRNRANGHPMFYLYYSRILLILDARYGIQGESYLPKPPQNQTVSQIVKVNAMTNSFEETGCDTQPCNITNHFFHNLVTSFLFLPSSFMFEGLWNTIKEGAPYWQAGWTGGEVNLTQSILIFVNLFFISLGIGVAWGKSKWLGMLPLIVFLVYTVSNSLAFTSAGRYVAPTDWIICLYYVLGIFQILLWFLRLVSVVPKVSTQVGVKDEAKNLRPIPIRYGQVVWSLAFVFMIGAFVPASELLFEKRYEVRDTEIIFADLEQKGLLEQAGFSQADFTEFLSQPQALIVEGRALYPRYYRNGVGEPDRSTYYRHLDFSRLVFTVIGPYSVQAQGVVIAGEKPNYPIHTTDVIVLGCWNTTYYAPFIDAVIVFINSEEGSYIYNRSPEHALQCPLQEPTQ